MSNAGRRSMRTTSTPRRAKVAAAVSPPTPPPTTKTRRLLPTAWLLPLFAYFTRSILSLSATLLIRQRRARIYAAAAGADADQIRDGGQSQECKGDRPRSATVAAGARR